MKSSSFWVLGVAVLAVAALAVLLLRGTGKEGSSESGAAGRDADRDSMVVIQETKFGMGSSAVHPDYRAATPVDAATSAEQVLLARAAREWSQDDEHPVREVQVSAFAIDAHEVSNAKYRRFLEWMKRTGDHGACHQDEPESKDHTPRYWRHFNPLLDDAEYAQTAPFAADTFMADDAPVVGVDWFDAFAYAAWAGKRLPTEAEWELASSGGDGRRWPWGDEWHWGRANTGGEKRGIDVAAHGFEKDGYIYAAPVGTFASGSSPFGCFDMAGNAAEWCADWYGPDYYGQAPSQNPAGPAEGTLRVVRGGSSRSYPSSVRCAARAFREPEFRNFDLGFRCARSL